MLCFHSSRVGLAYTDSPEDRDRRFHAAFQAFLRRAVEEGRVRDDVPVETLAEVVSSSFAFMSLSWLHFDDYPVRERAASAARFLRASFRAATALSSAAPSSLALPFGALAAAFLGASGAAFRGSVVWGLPVSRVPELPKLRVGST